MKTQTAKPQVDRWSDNVRVSSTPWFESPSKKRTCISPATVQAQQVLTGQRYACQPAQELPTAQPAVALLDRPDLLIERCDDSEPVDQLGDREQPAAGVSDGSDAPIRTR